MAARAAGAAASQRASERRRVRTKRGCGIFSSEPLLVVKTGFSAAARFDTMLWLLAARAKRANAPASRELPPLVARKWRKCAHGRAVARVLAVAGRRSRPARRAHVEAFRLPLVPPGVGAKGGAQCVNRALFVDARGCAAAGARL